MKKEKRANFYASLLFLFCISAMFLLSSCSKQSGKVEIQSTPTPAKAKMEGQSANWKVTVKSIEKVPKPPEDALTKLNPYMQHDTLQINLDVEYTGPAGDVQSPEVSLIDGKGQKIESLKAAFLPMPDDIVSMRNVPLDKVDEIMDSPEYKKRTSEIGELMGWIDPSLPDYKKKPRTLKSGEKFSLSYSFQDPKEYANLKLVFNDVPPILLKAPQDEKPK